MSKEQLYALVAFTSGEIISDIKRMGSKGGRGEVKRGAVRGHVEKSVSPEEMNLIFVGSDPVYRL
jgi:hypothetical protein